jgi:predicted nucleic acid-binding protein
MKRLSIYFDTSIINYHFADDTPEKKDLTIEYFKKYVKTNFYQHFISDFVIAEIERTKDKKKREMLFNIIQDNNIEYLPIDPEDEIQELASYYLKLKILPKKKIDDALHIAITTVKRIDILLSWNFRHLANINKEKQIMIANLESGYNFTPRLTNPMEVFHG